MVTRAVRVAGICYGLEEEVFITEPEKPSLQSLYYLARLLWRSPRYYYTHTACNFSRGKDLRQGIMSGVEISTGVHQSPSALVADLAVRRMELAAVCQGLLVPVGHLFDQVAPTNVCGMHVHIGGAQDMDRVYRNLMHFLPLLALITANSPLAGGKYYGPSFRWAHSFAIGNLQPDRRYRFQDMIYSKRLGTIEIRVFDPVWDLTRVRVLLECIDAVVRSERTYTGDQEWYNHLRLLAARNGYGEELQGIYRELRELLPVSEELFRRPPAGVIHDLWQRQGTLATYAALDNAYRGGQLAARPVSPMPVIASHVLAGLFFYYLFKLPYNLRKVWLEW